MKLYHGVAYYPELWPESDVDKDIAEMKKLGINLVRIAEFAWSKMEPDEGRISMAFFKRVMDKLHKAGIAVCLCTPTATPPIWLTHNQPDRMYIDAKGQFMVHGARQHASYDHPKVESACLKIVKAMAKALGNHPSLIAWQIDNEFKCHVAEDFNAHSIKRWHKWLKQKFKTITALNEAWGTEIWSERYQSFEQIPAPLPTPFVHHASLSTAYREFSRERIAEFMDDQSGLIRKHSKAPITHNMNPHFSLNFERMCENLDFASYDGYPSHDKWGSWVMYADVFRDAVPGKPFWLMETSVTHNGWFGDHESTHPAGYLLAESTAVLALGGQTINYWLWRQQRTGCELPHSAVMSSWFKPTLGYEEVKSVSTMMKDLGPLLKSTVPAPVEAAVTWSDLGRMMLQTEPLGASKLHTVSFFDQVKFWQHELVNLGVNRAIRFEGADLKGLKLLITPAMPYVSANFAKKLKKWISDGGVWLCVSPTGTRAEHHTVSTDAGLGLVDEIAGVETVFSFPATQTQSTVTAFSETAPVAGWSSVFRPTDASTQVLGAFKSTTHADGLALITQRAIGKGHVVMLGAPLNEPQASAVVKKLLDHVLKLSGASPRWQTTPGTLVCPRHSKDGKTTLIAVNMDGQGGAITTSAGKVEVPRYEYRVIESA